jgi:hypothetical protein
VTGHFTKALVDVEPGKVLVGSATKLSWKQWAEIWGAHNRKTIVYEEAPRSELENAIPGGAGRELADMFEYIDKFGYDGSDPEVVYPKDVSSPSIDEVLSIPSRSRTVLRLDADVLGEAWGRYSRHDH